MTPKVVFNPSAFTAGVERGDAWSLLLGRRRGCVEVGFTDLELSDCGREREKGPVMMFHRAMGH
jgi:hypothetical protein